MSWPKNMPGKTRSDDSPAGAHSDWTTTKLKYIADAIAGGTPDTENLDYWDKREEGIRWIAIGDMSQRETVETSKKSLTRPGLLSKSLRIGEPGTVLFAMYASVGEVAMLKIPATWNQAILGLVAREKICTPVFLFYFLKTVRDYLPFMYRSNTQNNLNAEQVLNLPVSLPGINLQRAITAYLDRETAKIDALIDKQEQLIATLREDRAATITQAVTKGPAPEVEMRNAGTKWIESVPSHWDVVPIKRLATTITDGAHISPETDGGVYDFVSTKDVDDRGIDFEGSLKTSPSSYEYLVRNGCQPEPGDVLFSKDGTIGRTVVVAERRSFVIASSLIIIRPDEHRVDSRFVHFLCQAVNVREQVESFVKGAGLPRLSISNLRKIVVPLPPLEEQAAITAILEAHLATVDSLIRKSTEAIDTLREYRSALITNAVTGKIDVREAV